MSGATGPARRVPELGTDLRRLQERLGHVFAQPGLLVRAVTHRSFSADHNERLEFLGDSVLNLAISNLLYGELSRLPEGDLSRIRANLVKQDTLVGLSTELGLPVVIRLGEGELKTGGRQRPSILADALEAVIGAVFLDAGYDPAAQVVQRLFRHIPVNPRMSAMEKDPKTELQEWLQGRKMGLPTYRVVSTSGAAHAQNFVVACEATDVQFIAQGGGTSRRSAEQAAASAMLEHLKTPKKK